MEWENKKEEEEFKRFIGRLHDSQMDAIPPEEDLKARYQLSEHFFDRMEALMQSQGKKARRKAWFLRFAAAAAVVLLLLSLTRAQFFVDAGETLVWDLVDRTSFQFEWHTDISDVKRYEMQYVPDGYALKKDSYYEICGCIIYSNQKGERLFLFYMPIDTELAIENEEKELLTISGDLGETIYYLKAKNAGKESSMVWVNEDNSTKFRLSGTLPEEELLKVIGKIRPIS